MSDAPVPGRVRRRIVVRGRVQGVWFRGSTQEQAHRHAVAGWVRNRADGAVEAVFEGPEHAVEALVAYCRLGPRHARVDSIEVADEACDAALEGFEIR